MPYYVPKKRKPEPPSVRCKICNSPEIHMFKRPDGIGHFCENCGFKWIRLVKVQSQPGHRFNHRIRHIGPQPPLTPGIPTGM